MLEVFDLLRITYPMHIFVYSFANKRPRLDLKGRGRGGEEYFLKREKKKIGAKIEQRGFESKFLVSFK